MYQVKKKDGTIGRFDRFGALSNAMRAGATAEEAEKATQKVENYIFSASSKGPVEHTKVRDQMIKALGSVNQMAARTYSIFQK